MWLYFTRSNGDVDNMPNQEDLKTATSRKDFIGDEATRFSVQKAVLNPVWDGSKYIKDVTNKEAERKAAKEARDEALQACTVEVNGNVYQTRPSDEANFRVRIMSLEAGQETQWLLENDKSAKVKKEELEQVYALGLAKIGAIWDTYINTADAL